MTLTSRAPRSRPTLRGATTALALAALCGACQGAAPAPDGRDAPLQPGIGRLPTGARLDPAGTLVAVGTMPLAAVISPSGRRVVLSLGGWRVQGVQVVDRVTGRVMQTLTQPSAFVGLAFAPDGRSLYASGGNEDVVYRYAWAGDSAVLADTIVLGRRPKSGGERYPAGVAVSPDGRTLYVAENLGDALAVVDLSTKRVRERKRLAPYPYAVAVAPTGELFVSSWTGASVAAFTPRADGTLGDAVMIAAGRHPSALLLNRAGTRLFVASASTDRVTVIDTRTHARVAELLDAPPGATEGSTPNALALNADESRLFVAEADNNAVAVFRLANVTRGAGGGGPSLRDSLVGRVPAGWYPTAVVSAGDTIIVANGKGRGTGPNMDGPTPARARTPTSHSYTLGQLEGTLGTVPASELASDDALRALSARVARANGWDRVAETARGYPPFEHVIYIIKENRTFDQVFSDLPQADGDSSLLFFPRAVSPNHHALAERFGIFDRFFVNAEVSPDGHNWSTAAYATDYLEKTVPSEYSSRGRSYDYEGTNRGFGVDRIIDDDVAEPANGYLWDALRRAGISFRNYGEFVSRADTAGARPDDDASGPQRPGRYVGNKAALRGNTVADYPGFDLNIRDQVRADVWLRDFAADVQSGHMPAFEILRLPNDHTAGAKAGSPTPAAFMGDNDLALGRMVEAVSRSPYWKNTVFFVLEDDAQNGPDHVDSHRSVLLVISGYSAGGVSHRWVNSADVVSTMLDILHAPHLSQFDVHARPLREIWSATPDLRPYSRLVPAVDSNAVNPKSTRGARDSRGLDLSSEDRADEDLFNRVLWRSIKGNAPYPGVRRASLAELRRSH